MNVAEWLDKKEAEQADMSHITLPQDMAYDATPDETLYFKEINPCTFFCTKNHPFAKVERYGHWYHCIGQDKKAGIHSSKMKWHLFTRDKALALQTAKTHIE